jgi:hypothetical protein
MSMGYGLVLEGYMLYPEVVILNDKIEDESEKKSP